VDYNQNRDSYKKIPDFSEKELRENFLKRLKDIQEDDKLQPSELQVNKSEKKIKEKQNFDKILRYEKIQNIS
jgi:hypothetical protein